MRQLNNRRTLISSRVPWPDQRHTKEILLGGSQLRGLLSPAAGATFLVLSRLQHNLIPGDLAKVTSRVCECECCSNRLVKPADRSGTRSQTRTKKSSTGVERWTGSRSGVVGRRSGFSDDFRLWTVDVRSTHIL
ncbi:hypothetical protein J6590_008179 [Homalodisca vitripennis]|nr:hypothetical protein J6590_008179 [Homalodisca vitripennis]